MYKKLFLALVGMCLGTLAHSQALRPLDDAELSKVSGQDGISIMIDLHLNQTPVSDPNAQSSMFLRFKDADGKANYLVFKNPHGRLGIFGIGIDVVKRPDGNGSDYVAVSLPGYVFFNDFGIDSLSAQSDPTAHVPFEQSLGRLNIDGTMKMTGQLRLWPH